MNAVSFAVAEEMPSHSVTFAELIHVHVGVYVRVPESGVRADVVPRVGEDHLIGVVVVVVEQQVAFVVDSEKLAVGQTPNNV
jgi:hypothetical protein